MRKAAAEMAMTTDAEVTKEMCASAPPTALGAENAASASPPSVAVHPAIPSAPSMKLNKFVAHMSAISVIKAKMGESTFIQK